MSDRLSLSQVAALMAYAAGRACIRAHASSRLLVFAEPLSMQLVIGIVLILCGLFFIAG
jgi:multidrug transporter EmrE-like cation transporter